MIPQPNVCTAEERWSAERGGEREGRERRRQGGREGGRGRRKDVNTP